MNVLLIYPEFPDTFWSFRHALKFAGKKASMPPTGLLTLSSMLPSSWNRRLVDMNTRRLEDRDVSWADLVMVSAMNAQMKSVEAVLERCTPLRVKTVCGGPLFSSEPEKWRGRVSTVVAGEAESVIHELIQDLTKGSNRFLYKSEEYPELLNTPVPDWSLMNLRDYETVGIQFSRGCPHKCDFCNVTALFGHRVRTKTTGGILKELNALYRYGWRGGIFFVDDNFIGNRKYIKESLLPALIEWRRKRETVTFQTETSILIADDDELLSLMARAGFNTVFIGVETPDENNLRECGKLQNTGRDLKEDIRKIQNAGIQVQAGFIVGFDGDGPSVFRKQRDFIRNSGIVTAMVTMLQAPAGTRLFQKMKEAGRISGVMTDGTDGTTNIIPGMGLKALQKGHAWLVKSIYSPGEYYRRVRSFLEEYHPAVRIKLNPSPSMIMAVPRSMIKLGIFGRAKIEYWKLILWTWLKKPKLLPVAFRLAIYGYHCFMVCQRLPH